MRLFDFKPYEHTEATVTAYLHDVIKNREEKPFREKYPSVVVCPGGGYCFCSPREADPVVYEYLSKGYNVFLLNYSVGENASNFNPLKELSSTVMEIRKNANAWNCDTDKIAVCGFSAGGHLCASLATLWNNERFLAKFDNQGGLNKPNAVILGYAAISSSEFGHKSSIMKVSGEESGEFYDFFSLEKRVTPETAPCFIWHTLTDPAVPVQNALVFADALRKNDVTFEMHIFPTGSHGLSVCNNETNSKNKHTAQWVDLSVKFLDLMFDFEY